MILTGYILLSCILAAIGLALGMLAAGLALGRLPLRRGPAPGAVGVGAAGAGDVDRGEEKEYLLLLVLGVAFGLRMAAWPLFYVALQSAVPHVPGAMCIFGVTRLAPLTSTLLQLLRPLLVFFLGGWFALRLAGSRRERLQGGPAPPRPRGERLLLDTALLLLLLDSALELLLFGSLRPVGMVYCCGSVYDLPGRLSAALPGGILGAGYAARLLPALYAVLGLSGALGLLLGAAALAAARGGEEWTLHGRLGRLLATRRRRSAWGALLALLGLAAGTLGLLVGMEVVTPRLTGLPYHHCLYCLVGKTSWGPALAALLATGSLGAWWAALLLPGPRQRRTPVQAEVASRGGARGRSSIVERKPGKSEAGEREGGAGEQGRSEVDGRVDAAQEAVKRESTGREREDPRAEREARDAGGRQGEGRDGQLRASGRLAFLSAGVFLALLLVLGLAMRSASGGKGNLGRCPGCDAPLFDSVYLVDLVAGRGPGRLFCSIGCARRWAAEDPAGRRPRLVTVRDEFTGLSLDSGAAFFVEAAGEIAGLPPGNRIHAYEYRENAMIMAFELDGSVIEDPFLGPRAEGGEGSPAE